MLKEENMNNKNERRKNTSGISISLIIVDSLCIIYSNTMINNEIRCQQKRQQGRQQGVSIVDIY